MAEITTGHLRQALNEHFRTVLRNPNWDVIGDIVNEMDPDMKPALYGEACDAAYTLWAQGKVAF